MQNHTDKRRVTIADSHGANNTKTEMKHRSQSLSHKSFENRLGSLPEDQLSEGTVTFKKGDDLLAGFSRRRQLFRDENKESTFSVAEEDAECDRSGPDGSTDECDWTEQMRNLHLLDSKRECKRTAMGEYVPAFGEKPLTLMALPTPGPADYEPKMTINKHAAPQYSIAGKSKAFKVQTSPGPSKYNTETDLVWKYKTITLKGKGNMLGVKQENEDWHQPLGSAAYLVEHGNFGTTTPKHTMGLRSSVHNGPPNALVQPVDTCGFNTPGPAEYQPNSKYLSNGQKKSFGLLLKKSLSGKSPGPAEYNIVRDVTNGPLYSFGARLHQENVTANNTPGPGSYNIGTTIGKSVAKSISGRQMMKKSDSSPSPNTYILPSTIGNGPKNSMTYRAFETSVKPTPGPTEYSLNKENLPKGPEFTCGKLCRLGYPDTLHHWKHALYQNPDVGPNSYNPSKGISKNDKPAYSIGTRFKQKVEDSPGPASYNVRKTQKQDSNSAPAFSIGKRIEENPAKEGPGPAAYNPQPDKFTRSHSMSGWNRRKQGDQSDSPAANAYTVQSGQTRRGLSRGPEATLKGRPSPYVYSGFRRPVKV